MTNEPITLYETRWGNQYNTLPIGYLPSGFTHGQVQTILQAIGIFYESQSKPEATENLLEAIRQQFKAAEDIQHELQKAYFIVE